MESNQEDRNLGMLAHGLVAVGGMASFASSLSGLGFLASIVSIVLYFVWKSSKSPYVVRHLKQAAGLQLLLFGVGIILAILGSGLMLASVASGNVGGLAATGGLLALLAWVIGILRLVLGILGLLQAQKGEAYTYPVVGQWIDNLRI